MGSKDEDRSTNAQHSTKSVLIALIGNSLVFIAKIIAFILTGGLTGGSSAILAEIAHSMGDVSNQGFLLLGIKRDQRKADKNFPFGYGKERYFWSAIAASLVCLMGLASMGKGIHGLIYKEIPLVRIESLALFGGAALIEGIVFIVALKGVRKDKKGTPLKQYLKKTTDPSGVAVLLEDFVAVLGVAIALGGILLTKATGSHVYDAAASMIIGLLVLRMGAYLIDMNRKLLIGRNDPEVRHAAEKIIRSHPAVEKIHGDVRAIVFGVEEIVIQADVEPKEEQLLKDINGGAKTRFAQIPRDDQTLADAVAKQISKLIDDLEREIKMSFPDRVMYIAIEVEHPFEPDKKTLGVASSQIAYRE